ncbi:MAG: hypothetical protein KAG04_01265 [Mycoplasmataceae bacterium]|nr:hypothetical protein [Mycoplasmataceae bacterium]
MTIIERDNIIMLFEKYNGLLTQTQRQCFQLHFFEDLSLAEISEIVASTRSAVHDAIKKATKKLIEIDKKIG